jgi:Flp pilus assembly protein TadG
LPDALPVEIGNFAMRKFLTDQNGNVAAIFALTAPLLVGAMGVAVDFSGGNRTKSDLQAASDSAALAGVRTLLENRSQPATSAEANAKLRAESFVSSLVPAADKIVVVSAAARTVVVNLAVEEPTVFSKWIGIATIPISATATAIYDEVIPTCMLALGENTPIGIEMIGSASVDAPNCTVASNSKNIAISLQGAPKVRAGKVCGVGLARGSTSPRAEKCGAIPDPNLEKKLSAPKGPVLKALLKAPIYSGPCDYKNVSIGANSKGTVTLDPGIYCGGLSVQSADVKLMPGLYQIQDGPLEIQGNASVTGSGVTILLSGTGAVLDLQGSPSLTLSPMTTGDFAGMAIVADTAQNPILNSRLQGSPTLDVTGSIYLPNQELTLQGSPTLNLSGPGISLAANSFELRGSPDINIKTSSTYASNSPIRLLR